MVPSGPLDLWEWEPRILRPGKRNEICQGFAMLRLVGPIKRNKKETTEVRFRRFYDMVKWKVTVLILPFQSQKLL